MDYETEEQQVEALKKWWKENGNMIFAGIAVGAILIVGWRYYNSYQQTHAEYASQSYENIVNIVTTSSDTTDAQAKANELYASYSDTPYASLSALMLAKKQLQKGEMQQAIQQLEWVVNNASQEELTYIARLRLARVLMASNKNDKALELLGVDIPVSFTALYEELKGDIYVSKGELDQARVAYDKAILSSGAQSSKWLKLKRDDLGVSDISKTNITEPTT
jgi:predicted negative regulator of RcsB-dependent stress response